jgi:hypothetical protein
VERDFAANRQDMSRQLEERMNRAYETLADGQRLETDSSLVKSYLVESTLAEEDADPERAQSVLDALLADSFLSTPRNSVDVSTQSGEDRSLITVWSRVGNKRFTSYFDVRNPRYWVVHSMGGSNVVDWFMKRLTTLGPSLDRAWIPIQLLELVAGLGSFRGLGLDFDHRPFLRSGADGGESEPPADPDVDDLLLDAESAPVEMLKVQLWGNKARDVLELLRSAHAFPNETTLAKVKVKYRLADDSDYFSLDDVKFDGKVTARGTSFQSHSDLLRAIQSRYAALLRSIESERLEWTDSATGVHMQGSALIFRFGHVIGDVDRFCATLFSGAEPFRLWGSPVTVGETLRRVHAVDLHVGQRLTIEIANDFLRLYLPGNACGNSVLRLYTNLQHTFDATVQVTTSGGESAIAL